MGLTEIVETGAHWGAVEDRDKQNGVKAENEDMDAEMMLLFRKYDTRGKFFHPVAVWECISFCGISVRFSFMLWEEMFSCDGAL
jgi:hypothetical protein